MANPSNRMKFNRICNFICEKESIERSQMLSGKRSTANVSIVRFILMYACKNVLGMTYKEIMDLTKLKSHYSIFHGIKRSMQLAETDPVYCISFKDIIS